MRHVAIGDPQAPLDTFLRILDGHGLLGDDGRLEDDVHLVSMGDHFDYGTPEQRDRATADGEAILSWLASHPPERVTILIGNHDVARVCELFPFDDATFLAAHREARELYAAEAPAEAFLAKYPTVPDAECLARDYSCFSTAQRALVTDLLRSRRLQLAAHHRGVLLVHAGVTEDDLSLANIRASDAAAASDGLNAWLDVRLSEWTGGPLALAPLHQVGSPSTGEGRGVLYHRPCDPSTQPANRLVGPPRRRFDPRRLPAAFPQAIGHIRDNKCRELMPAWSPPGAPIDGPLRSLTVTGAAVTYEVGCRADARLFFTDAGMSHAPPEQYELFDLDARAPLSRP
ncbi:MAG: metallophosphoesterase [Myxococcaceae bacterium]|nr:metallophosphoesterase [Myxococcaceae bacterium]